MQRQVARLAALTRDFLSSEAARLKRLKVCVPSPNASGQRLFDGRFQRDDFGHPVPLCTF